MIELREMQLIVALARHGHFARAASECGISQPAFSMRVRNLEARLGVTIVKRGNRFQGFTDQGERFLVRARKVLEEARAIEQDLAAQPGKITGTLTLGAIPTALGYAAGLSAQLRAAHPGIVTRILSRTSLQILQGLEDRTLDAGLTYCDGVPEGTTRLRPLYEETYVLVAPPDLAPRLEGQVTWLEAAQVPLCLLEPGMQNRRILDRQFHEVGAVPAVVGETNAFTASLVMVAEGFAATILPASLAEAVGHISGAALLPLGDPVLAKPIGFVTQREAKGLPMLEALEAILPQ